MLYSRHFAAESASSIPSGKCRLIEWFLPDCAGIANCDLTYIKHLVKSESDSLMYINLRCYNVDKGQRDASAPGIPRKGVPWHR